MTILIVLAVFTALFIAGACKASSDKEKADKEAAEYQKRNDLKGGTE